MVDHPDRARLPNESGVPHRPERMFCIKNGKIMVPDPGITGSHLEWFRKMGWIGSENGNEEDFFHHVISGYYIPDEDALHCFRELDFSSDPELVDMIARHIPQLKKFFNLGSHTKIFVGPRDSGEYVGMIEQLLKNSERHEHEFDSGIQ